MNQVSKIDFIKAEKLKEKPDRIRFNLVKTLQTICS